MCSSNRWCSHPANSIFGVCSVLLFPFSRSIQSGMSIMILSNPKVHLNSHCHMFELLNSLNITWTSLDPNYSSLHSHHIPCIMPKLLELLFVPCMCYHTELLLFIPCLLSRRVSVHSEPFFCWGPQHTLHTRLGCWELGGQSFLVLSMKS